MKPHFEQFARRLREARNARKLSQRDLSKLAGVPQSHISKIESNQVDLRLSSLIAIANALDLEVTLVPRKALPAVRSIARQAETAASATSPASTEAMQRLQDRLRELQINHPPRPELDAARKAYAALKPLPLDSSALSEVRRITRTLGRHTEQWATITEAAKQMQLLRNRLVHAYSPEDAFPEGKPAYTLDDDEE
jgi:transcriptional regulator with XRE-family HTH domain